MLHVNPQSILEVAAAYGCPDVPSLEEQQICSVERGLQRAVRAQEAQRVQKRRRHRIGMAVTTLVSFAVFGGGGTVVAQANQRNEIKKEQIEHCKDMVTYAAMTARKSDSGDTDPAATRAFMAAYGDSPDIILEIARTKCEVTGGDVVQAKQVFEN